MNRRSGAHRVLIEQELVEARATLDAVLSGQVDAIVDARSLTPVLLGEAQDALQKSQRRLRDIIDGLAPSIFVGLMTPDGIVLESNQPALAAAGLRAEDVLSEPIENTFWGSASPDHQERLRSAVARGAAGEASRYDTQVRGANGTRIDVDFSLAPLHDESGNVTFLVSSAMVITERKQMELALRESDEKFRQLANNVSDVFWIRSPDMQEVHFISPGFERIWGIPAAMLQARPLRWIDMIHAGDRDRVVAEFGTLRAEARSIDVEYRIVRPDGDLRWVRTRGFQVRDAAGQLVRLTGTVSDITDRKQAELSCQESEMQYRALVDWSPEAIVVSRANRVIFVNPAAIKMLGAVSSDELVGRHVLDSVHPDSRDVVLDRLRHVTTAGAALPMVPERLVKLDGTVIDVEIQALSIGFNGEPAVFSSVHDVTERKQAAAALQASVDEFRTLADAMPQMVWITRPGDGNIYVNQQWLDYTGLTLEESHGTGWSTPFHPDDRSRALSAWQHATTTVGTYMIESRLRRADGEYRWWLIRGIPHQDADGTITRWFGTCTDIHDLKMAELEVSRINRALTLLSSCSEVLARAESEIDLLNQVARIAVEHGGYRLAWVGYAQDDASKSVTPITQAGDGDDFLAAISITWQEGDPIGEGPGGRAIRSGNAVVCEDIARETNVEHWMAIAQHYGYRKVIALPLRNPQRTFGVLALYSAEVATTSPEELKLLQALADDLAFGIGNQRARAEQRRVQAAVLRVAAGVSASSGTTFFQQLVRNMAEALGAQAAFVSRVLPGDKLGAHTLAAVVDGRAIDNFDYLFAGTPCEQLLTLETVVITGDAASRFPFAARLASLGAQGYVGRRLESSLGQPLGHLFVVFTEPLTHVGFITSTLQIFAARAASELERQDTDDRVREQAALLDIAHEAIQVRDLDGRIIYWNKGAERTYGWPSAEALGRDDAELLGTDVAESRSATMAVMSRGEWRGEMVKYAHDGRALTMEARWTLVRDETGAPKSVLAFETDITERKQFEAQFLRSQRMEGIGTLAGGIAHDLNNVLSPIMISVEMLKDLARNQFDLDLLDTLLSSARRGADLVKQVLSFARGVEGQRIAVDPLAVMRDLLKIMHDTFPKSVDVNFAPARGPWTVTGDPTQIHQVFLNLCVNARDAMPDGGCLSIEMDNVLVDDMYAAMHQDAEPGAFVQVIVRDTGIGMSVQTRDRIFEPFFTTKEIGRGTGLGLSTTAAIVRSHGGFITLTTAVGQGTTFEVYLPANPDDEAGVDTTAVAGSLPRGNGELVLLVDDEDAVRTVARHILERFGYRVVGAANGAEALALYATRGSEIAVVLTDMSMPVMDGTATIRALKAIDPAVRIIASSGLASNETLVRLGVHNFVAKPYTADTILQTLHDMLQTPEDAAQSTSSGHGSTTGRISEV